MAELDLKALLELCEKATPGPWPDQLPGMVIDLRERLTEWQDYWGCDSPHDTHVQIGNTQPRERQLGKEQARANTLQNQNAVLEQELVTLRGVLTALRDAVKAEPSMQGRKFVDLGIAVNNALDTRKPPQTTEAL